MSGSRILGLFYFYWFALFKLSVMVLFYLIVFNFSMLCCYCLDACSVLLRDRKEVSLTVRVDGVGLGGI